MGGAGAGGQAGGSAGAGAGGLAGGSAGAGAGGLAGGSAGGLAGGSTGGLSGLSSAAATAATARRNKARWQRRILTKFSLEIQTTVEKIQLYFQRMYETLPCALLLP